MRNKRLIKLMAIALSVAMLGTSMFSTSVLATGSISENDITEISVECSDEEAKIIAANEENEVEAQSANPAVLVEGKDQAIPWVYWEDYKDYGSVYQAEAVFVPQKTGEYIWSIEGYNYEIDQLPFVQCDNHYIDIKSDDEWKQHVILRQGLSYHFFYQVEATTLDERKSVTFQIKMNNEFKMDSVRNVSDFEDTTDPLYPSTKSIDMNEYTLYPINITEVGEYHWTFGFLSVGSNQLIEIYDSELKKVSPLYFGGNTYRINIIKPGIYYAISFFKGNKLTVNKANSFNEIECDSSNVLITDSLYSFIPKKTGWYSFDVEGDSISICDSLGQRIYWEYVDWRSRHTQEFYMLEADKTYYLNGMGKAVNVIYCGDATVIFGYDQTLTINKGYSYKATETCYVYVENKSMGTIMYILPMNDQESETITIPFGEKKIVKVSVGQTLRMAYSMGNSLTTGSATILKLQGVNALSASSENTYSTLPNTEGVLGCASVSGLEEGIYTMNVSGVDSKTQILYGYSPEDMKMVLSNSTEPVKIDFSISGEQKMYVSIMETDGTQKTCKVSFAKKNDITGLKEGKNVIDVKKNMETYYSFIPSQTGYYEVWLSTKGYGEARDTFNVDVFGAEKVAGFFKTHYVVKLEKNQKYDLSIVGNVDEKRNLIVSKVKAVEAGKTLRVNAQDGVFFQYTALENGLKSVEIKDIDNENYSPGLLWEEGVYLNVLDRYDKDADEIYFRSWEKGKTYFIFLIGYTNCTDSLALTVQCDEEGYIADNEANVVEKMISDLGALRDLTLSKEEDIKKARAAYNALSNVAKEKVDSYYYELLVKMEEKLAKLKAQKAAEDKAKAEAQAKAEAEAKAKAEAEAKAKAEAEAKRQPAVGETVLVDGVSYVVSSTTTVSFSKADATEKAVKIPATVKIKNQEYKVTEISANTFAGNKVVTSVTMGKNVKVIGKNAFKKCEKLKTVAIGSNVTTINDNAFNGCKKLTKITIPSKVTKIGKNAFNNCKLLKTVTIKTKKLKSVGASAFKNNAKNAKFKVPSSKVKAYSKLLNKKTSKGAKITK